jgi:hypothetical protein
MEYWSQLTYSRLEAKGWLKAGGKHDSKLLPTWDVDQEFILLHPSCGVKCLRPERAGFLVPLMTYNSVAPLRRS